MGQRLLIVDGDRRFIRDHQVALEAAFDVDFLHSTDGVLPLLENGDFAAVLICVEVSENKGYAICSAIRKNPHLVNLKVSLISAKATEEEYARHRSLKGKADLYLHKPLISSALIASLSPLVPTRSVDPDNPLGDLSGADLGDEWLESLKTELDTDDRPYPTPAPPISAHFLPTPPIVPPKPMPPPLAPVSIALPAALQKAPTVAPDSGKIELLQSRVKDLESKLQDLDETLGRKDQEFQDLRGKHDSATRNLDDMEQQRKDSDLLQQRLMESENRIQSLQADAARDEESSAALRKSMEDAESERHRLQGLMEELGRQLADEERDKTALWEAKQGLEERLSELQNLQNRIQELQAEGDRLREAARAAEELQGRNQELEGRVWELQEDASRVAGEVERTTAELQGRLGEMERTFEAMQGRLHEAEGRAGEQETQVAELQNRLNAQTELELQLAEVREELGRQEARVVEMQAQRDAKAQELSEKERESEGLKVDVAGFEATLRGQRRELADQGGRLGSLTRECENLQTKLTQLDERTQELARVLSEKMQVLAERDDEISELRRGTQEQEKTLAETTQLLEDRERDIVQLRNTKDQLGIHCEDLEREMTMLVNQHEQQQLELMKGVDEREAQIGRLNSTLEALHEQIANLGREKQVLEGNLNERSARLEALTGAITDLENSIRRASDLTRPF